MGKSYPDEGCYRACAECTRVCQTTHGEGLPRSLPRFARLVPDYALPFAKDCNMQIPACYLREHMPGDREKKVRYILVGATGAEWVVDFHGVALKDGWKVFATDHRLEKGDVIMFALIAPKRFCVQVFDKFGTEKLSTREAVNSRGSPSAVINRTPQLGRGNGTPGSNDRGGADGTPQCTPTQAPERNGVCAASWWKTSGKTGMHDEKLIPLSRKRASIEKDDDLPQEPGIKSHGAEPSSWSESSIASDDSIQVRLAKEVLRSRRRKLKKRRMSCRSSPQVEAEAEAARNESTALGGEVPELCKNVQTEDIADKISEGVGTLSGYVAPAANPRGDVDETMCTKPVEDSIVGLSNDDEVAPYVGDEAVNLSNAVPAQEGGAVDEKVPPAHSRGNEALVETETARVATGEDVLKVSETRRVGEVQPSLVFEPGLVKQELDFGESKHFEVPVKKKTSIQLEDLKAVRSDNPQTPEVRNPSSNAPGSSAGRVTEDQKQRALIAAKELSDTRTNPHGMVVMRVSFNVKSYESFLSLQCSEMLPPEPAELILLDSKGVSCKVDWNAGERCLQGPGWREFVDSHHLQVHDVFVLEMLENSEQRCLLLVHIFHAHEMENVPVQRSSAGRGCVQAALPGPKTRSSNVLHGCSPVSASGRTKALDVDEVVLRPELPRRASPDVERTAILERLRKLPTKRKRNSRRTLSRFASTPGRVMGGPRTVTPLPRDQRRAAHVPNVDEAVVGTEPVAITGDAASADAELPGPSTRMRFRRVSSSYRKPAAVGPASPSSSDADDEPRDLYNPEINDKSTRAVRVGLRAGKSAHRIDEQVTFNSEILAEKGWENVREEYWTCKTARKFVHMSHIDKLFPRDMWERHHSHSKVRPKHCISPHFANRCVEVWNTLFPNKPFGSNGCSTISYSLACMVYVELQLKRKVDWRTLLTRNHKDKTTYPNKDIPDNFQSSLVDRPV